MQPPELVATGALGQGVLSYCNFLLLNHKKHNSISLSEKHVWTAPWALLGPEEVLGRCHLSKWWLCSIAMT